MENEHKPFLLGIAGGSGSGKTTLIQKIRAFFPENELAVLSQDNYYYCKEKQFVDRNGVINFDLPTSIDLPAFHQDIVRLMEGKPAIRTEYTFNNKLANPKEIVVNPAPVIVAEGLFVFSNEALKSLYDMKIMVEASVDRKIIRRIKRDRLERNYPLEDVLYRYEHHVVPAFEAFIAPHKKDVDLIINNNFSFDLSYEMLICFLKEKINQHQ